MASKDKKGGQIVECVIQSMLASTLKIKAKEK